MTLADKINAFNRNLDPGIVLDDGVEWINPFRDEQVLRISGLFYNQYFSDCHLRKLILGINPGRFGGGVTGIPFTDPVKLQEICRIPNDLKKVPETSAGFIYDMIAAYGGPDRFYSEYLIQAVCPLGFLKNGINYNYYDSPRVQEQVLPFIVNSICAMSSFGVNPDICYCLGNGKNYRFLTALNEKHCFFREVVALPHPRWIAQYRRKEYRDYIRYYLEVLS